MEGNLASWRYALERKGVKVSHSETEYLCVNERDSRGTMRLQGAKMKKVDDYKCLKSTIQSKGEGGKEVMKHVQEVWNR